MCANKVDSDSDVTNTAQQNISICRFTEQKGLKKPAQTKVHYIFCFVNSKMDNKTLQIIKSIR